MNREEMWKKAENLFDIYAYLAVGKYGPYWTFDIEDINLERLNMDQMEIFYQYLEQRKSDFHLEGKCFTCDKKMKYGYYSTGHKKTKMHLKNFEENKKKGFIISNGTKFN